ncbi:MAG: M28 family peptidase [Promethearchaeota archaeon]
MSLTTPNAWSQVAALPSLNSCSVSPPVLSPPSVAYLTNSSSLAYWQREMATCVNSTRLMGLLTFLAGYNSRHPFHPDANASIDFIASYLMSIGTSFVSDWFCIPKATWTGTTFIYQNFWTRNLYVTPWSINTSASTIIITCHLDSARYDLLGLSTTIAHGANDNAAGIATLLEALHILVACPGSFNKWNVLFAFLGGEEGNGTQSLWGSNQLLSHGLLTLGINPSTAFILNIDEIAYAGLVWPTILALYYFSGDYVSPLQQSLLETSVNLNIPLVDTQTPRIETIEDLHHDFGWCISEWTFHTNGIPAITISTNQYPDPYKHSLYDGVSHCKLINLINTTQLILGLVFDFVFDLPPTPPNKSADWVPVFKEIANITITDYLDPRLGKYQALIIDPLVFTNDAMILHLTRHSLPLLALGKGGALFLHHSAHLTFTDLGANLLTVNGLKVFHPVIQSSSLLNGAAAQLFRNCSTVHAVSVHNSSLVLVGNTIWSSLAYFPPALTSIPVLFLGPNLPNTPTVQTIAENGLAWLIEHKMMGIGLGLDQQEPVVGRTLTLYIFVGDFTNWTGLTDQLVHLNLTVQGTSMEFQVITNGSGVASVSLFLKVPLPYLIHAHSALELEGWFLFVPRSLCSAHLEYLPSIPQGELLTIFCKINSSWMSTVYVNLSLSAEEVGFTSIPNLLLIPGENVFHITLEIQPSCTPRTYNLSLQISTSSLLLLADHVPLIVEPAFILTVLEKPESTLQNQLFSVMVNLTNLGTQTRIFDIMADSNFLGFTQVIVQSNTTRSIILQLQYVPTAIMDTGIRSLSLALYSSDQRILAVESPIYVGYSTVNTILTLLPPAFLIALCIIGICWLRNGKRSQHQNQANTSQSPRFVLPGDQGMQIHWGTSKDDAEHQFRLTPQIKHELAQVIQKLELTKSGKNRYSNDRVVLAWEKKGQELHILLQGNNRELIQPLFKILSESTFTQKEAGDHSEP